jgi:hypothetical protein
VSRSPTRSMGTSNAPIRPVRGRVAHRSEHIRGNHQLLDLILTNALTTGRITDTPCSDNDERAMNRPRRATTGMRALATILGSNQ